MITLTAHPVIVGAPIQENISDIVVRGDYVVPITNPSFPIKTPSLGININDYPSILQKYNWDWNIAYKIMMAESKGNPKAINWNDQHKGCNGSFGLFQLACLHGESEELLNPVKNIAIAYSLWKREGWKPWSVCNPPNKTVDCYN